MKNRDLFHGQGNATVKSSIPTRITNKAGKTDPEQKNPGKLLKTVKKTEKGWNK